jgi:hypothetical protein
VDYPVVGIGARAFRFNTTIKTVTFSNNIEKICYQAFQGCLQLATVIFKHPAIALENSAFLDTGITSVEISARRIDNYAFAGCRSLTRAKITCPNGYNSSIGRNAFENNSQLRSVEFLGDNLAYIGQQAFFGLRLPS